MFFLGLKVLELRLPLKSRFVECVEIANGDLQIKGRNETHDFPVETSIRFSWSKSSSPYVEPEPKKLEIKDCCCFESTKSLLLYQTKTERKKPLYSKERNTKAQIGKHFLPEEFIVKSTSQNDTQPFTPF